MMPTKGWFTFDGITKHDHVTGKCEVYEFGLGIFGSEVCFAPRINSTDEDDGYLISIITDVNKKTSACVLFDAKNISQWANMHPAPSSANLLRHSCDLGSDA